MIIKRADIRRMKLLDDKMNALCVSRDIMKLPCPERSAVKVLQAKLAEARIKIKQLKNENMNLKHKAARYFGEGK